MSETDKKILVAMAVLFVVGVMWLLEADRAHREEVIGRKVRSGELELFDASSPQEKKRATEYDNKSTR